MTTCKAIIHEGSRKGEACTFPPSPTGYCGKHSRNKVYDDGLSEGKHWCRFFFRGCNTILSDEDIKKGSLSCSSCKETGKGNCSHEGCLFKTNTTFCKKHERDIYYNEEKEKGVKYCDIPRGCFTPVTDTKQCKECLEKKRISDSKRRQEKKKLLIAAQEVNATYRSCIKCSKDFEPFITHHGKESVKCKDCSVKQSTQDAKRVDRIRNYKTERLNNLKSSYKAHTKESLTRGHGDSHLSFDEFTGLVTGSCYYCTHRDENETIGIDRINNDIGYTKENCVPACWTCNKMKHFYHPSFFVDKCKILIKDLIPTKEFYTQWSIYYKRSCNKNYTTYKRDAEETRHIEFELTEEQWDWLTRSACYLCGFQDSNGIGIDRVNNAIRKYSFDNCRPCCGSCNTIKGELSLDQLLNHCKKVVTVHTLSRFDTIQMSKNPLKKTEPIEEKRSHWKARGLYYSILSDSAQPFLDTYSDIYTREEFETMCKEIKGCAKSSAIHTITILLSTLRKRRFRHKLTLKTDTL